MDALQFRVDFDEFNCQDGIQYEIGGWAVSPGGKAISMMVFADDTISLPFIWKTEDRADVQEAMPDLVKAPNIGFRICMADAYQLLKPFHTLTFWIVEGDKQYKALHKSIDDILQLYYDQTLTYKIDVLEESQGLLTMQGWVIGFFHDERIHLLDENHQQIPHEIMRMIRTDVHKAYETGKDSQNDQCGFQIHVKREEISCREIHLRFSNRMTAKEFVLDLRKFDYQNSKRGRLAELLGRDHRQENMELIRKEGIRSFVRYIYRNLEPAYADYQIWMKEHRTKRKELARQRKETFSYQPKISIVIPLYNTPKNFLKIMMDSLLNQTYGNLEICLADGSSQEGLEDLLKKTYGGERRIKYRRLKENKGISGNTNEAVRMATGEFILLGDHDDLVEADAVYEIVKVLNERPDTDIIYTDEDKVSMDGKKFYGPNFKSDFNLDLLRSVNYICHIFCVRREVVKAAGLFRSEYDGAQDYDFILRCIEKTDKIYHIPKALYHWRAHPDSTASNPASKQYAIDAGKRALEAHLERVGLKASVENTDIFGIYRVRYQVVGQPLVSIIIPNKDHVEDLDLCISSVVEGSSYRNFEIIVVENNSSEAETFKYYEEVCRRYPMVRVLVWEREFNYSAINNFGAREAKGDYLLLMNNDIEVINKDWLGEMLGVCQREEVGIVGAKLFYPDDTIQHAGVVIGMGGIAGHVLCKAEGKEYGYNARLVTMQDISAVTAACLMIRRDVFDQVGGLDEKFQVAFNDIDLCLKVREQGKLVVFDPYVTMYHYESKSRGLEDTPEKLERFRKEVDRFQKKWKTVLQAGDPYYNKNLTLVDGDCSLKKATEV